MSCLELLVLKQGFGRVGVRQAVGRWKGVPHVPQSIGSSNRMGCRSSISFRKRSHAGWATPAQQWL